MRLTGRRLLVYSCFFYSCTNPSLRSEASFALKWWMRIFSPNSRIHHSLLAQTLALTLILVTATAAIVGGIFLFAFRTVLRQEMEQRAAWIAAQEGAQTNIGSTRLGASLDKSNAAAIH